MSELSQESKYVLLAALRKRVTEEETRHKAAFSDAMLPTERRVAAIDVDGVGRIKLGSVTRTAESESWDITDFAAFEAWVKANRPEWLKTVTYVSEQAVADVKARAKANGGAFDPDSGDEIPGLKKRLGTSYVKALPDKDIDETLPLLIQSGSLTWAQILELEK
ncbi:hypothetical protein [Psychromicrobium lacuslunae]|uniref:Uncharacterized protein n=1 Tax=Psychromicrobium lacuslunae TaxID=1618207 RepID=A0A0D4C1V4_9MICC|nr:hypothetical protein [Psychromicrobium lacuslunae]AJT42395.1 hypothetical protein UM93_14445 [Psychromicrobium lacuslunae]